MTSKLTPNREVLVHTSGARALLSNVESSSVGKHANSYWLSHIQQTCACHKSHGLIANTLGTVGTGDVHFN